MNETRTFLVQKIYCLAKTLLYYGLFLSVKLLHLIHGMELLPIFFLQTEQGNLEVFAAAVLSPYCTKSFCLIHIHFQTFFRQSFFHRKNLITTFPGYIS